MNTSQQWCSVLASALAHMSKQLPYRLSWRYTRSAAQQSAWSVHPLPPHFPTERVVCVLKLHYTPDLYSISLSQQSHLGVRSKENITKAVLVPTSSGCHLLYSSYINFLGWVRDHYFFLLLFEYKIYVPKCISKAFQMPNRVLKCQQKALCFTMYICQYHWGAQFSMFFWHYMME